MNILHVVSSYDPAKGGPQAVVTRLAAAQAALGHEVTIMSYCDPVTKLRADAATAGIPGFVNVRKVLLPFPNVVEKLSAFHANRALIPLIRHTDFVHIHGIWETILLCAGRLARRFNVNYCVCSCGMLDVWSMQQKSWKKKLALKLGFRRMLDGATFIHALNMDEVALMQPLGLKAPTQIIPNGIFVNEIEPPEVADTAKQAVPFPNGRYVLFLSRLHYKKGLDILADAFKHIAAAFPDVDLVVAGPDGGAQEDFIQRIKRHGLETRIHLTGGLYGAAKIAALHGAACFCLPSRQEGFSVAITEALGCGVPVVITEACHFPEIAEAGAGLICRLDSQDIAHALTSILDSPEKADRMRQAGKTLVRENYTWPHIASQTIEIYRAYQDRNKPPVTQPEFTQPISA